MADGTLQELADFLATGYWDAAGSITRRWNLTDTGPGAMGGQITYSVSGNWVDGDGISSVHADLVRTAFQYLENITGIDFVETTSTVYDEVNIAFGDNYGGAYSYLDNGVWDVYGESAFATHAVVNVNPTWYNGGASVENDYVLQTFIHEILHALGLGHQGYYNGSANYPTDADFDNDSWQNSIMSYFTTTQNTTVDADFAFLQSAMAADLLALDALYGSQSYNGTTFGTGSAFLGDTVYGFNTNISADTDKLMANLGTYSYDNAYCIVDAGGNDTLDMSGWSYDQLLNLTISSSSDTAPSVSNIGGLTGNLTLAVGTVIENAIGGSGDDLIYGNTANNFLVGNSGNDSLYGDDGNDEIFGSQGDDYLKGGSGDDLIVGNRGDDKMYGGSGDDTMVWNNGDGSDRMDGDSGHDTVQVNGADGAGDEFEIRSNGDHVEFERVNLGPFTLDIRDTEQLEVRGQGGDDSIDASDLDAGQIKLRLYGGDGDDTITGSEGRDYINGGNGDDLMTGGDGADTFLFRRGGDTITDFENGVDRIKISAGNEYDSWDEVVAVATQEGNDVEIDFGGNDVLTLENFDINNLDASDFLF